MKSFYEIIESLLTSFIIITLLILFVFRAVAVDGASMYPTLHDKDRIITTNFFYTPQKGDIVVIDKNNHLNKPLVKRVIATEGDSVKIDYTTGEVYVNGTLLVENYINEKINPNPSNQLDIIVQEDEVFVMGDNRNNSQDSRDPSLGCINRKNILGKAVFKIFPFSRIGSIK